MSRMRMRWWASAALLLMLVPALAACGSTTGGGTSSVTKKYKVGLVTDTGGLNDQGFNHLAYVGLQKAKTDFGIQADVVESKSDADYVPNLTTYATGGYDLVIAVGFLMQTAVGSVAKSFPNIHFAIIDGAGTDANGNDLQLPNVQSLLFREQDAGALVGVIAGVLEKDNLSPKKSGIISAVGGVSIPPVNHYIAGYKWAATMEDPSVKVLIGYSNKFDDPTPCRNLANSQIDQGADIVFQVAGGCGIGALTAAASRGVYGIGVDTDQKAAASTVIASALKRVEVATYDAIQAVVQNKFQGGVTTFSLQNDGVGYAPGNITLPADVQAELTKISGEIKSGQLTPPADIPNP